MKNIKIIALLVMTLVVVLACFTSCETLQQIPGINQIPGIKPEEHVHSYENGKCTGCGELEPGYSCLNHTWGEEITHGADPTCTEDGYNLVTCTVCGYQRKLPVFRYGHNYTDEQTFVIAGTCTTPGSITKICTRCAESDVTETPMHPNTAVDAGFDADCFAPGEKAHMECPDCGKMWGDQACTKEVTAEDILIEAYGHEYTHVEAVEPNCHQEGNVEFWYCQYCGYAWLDAEGTQVTNLKRVILPCTAEIVNVAATEANCHQDGNIAYSYCSECFYAWTVDEEGNKMTTTFKDVVILHTAEIINVDAVEANCHQNGNIAYSYCAECFYAWTVDEEGNKMTTNAQSVVIPATVGLRYVEATQANCHQNGYDAHYVCDECEARFLDAAGIQLTNIRNLTNSTATAEIVYVPAAPACHVDGVKEHYYCAECEYAWTVDEDGNQMTTTFKDVIIPATLTLTHVEAVAPTCTANGSQEYWYCESCEAVYSDAEGRYLTNRMNLVLVATGHDYVDGYCTVCGGVDPDYYFPVSIDEALAAEDGSKVEVSGTVCTINTAWSDSYGNITVTIVDDAGNELYIYRLATKVALGDIITVKGAMATYNDNRQIGQGATATITGHDESYDVIPEYTIPDALKADDNTNVVVTGTVVKIGTAYSSSFDNISVYIADENGVQLYLYRLAGNVSVGQIIKVSGAMATYNGARQLTGGTFEAVGTHTCSKYTDATCVKLSACVVCGATTGELLDHVYVDGVCSGCGAAEGVELVVEKLDMIASAGALASDALTISWESDSFKVVVAKGTNNNAIRTSDSDHFRVYQGNNMTISGSKMTKVVITCTSADYATVCAGSLSTTGVTATVDGTVVTLTVSGTLDSIEVGATAQWRCNNIEVTYQK